MQLLQMQMGMKTLVILIVALFFALPSVLQAKQGAIYVVVVGVSNYQYIPSLTLPERDARMIAELYTSCHPDNRKICHQETDYAECATTICTCTQRRHDCIRL